MNVQLDITILGTSSIDGPRQSKGVRPKRVTVPYGGSQKEGTAPCCGGPKGAKYAYRGGQKAVQYLHRGCEKKVQYPISWRQKRGIVPL